MQKKMQYKIKVMRMIQFKALSLRFISSIHMYTIFLLCLFSLYLPSSYFMMMIFKIFLQKNEIAHSNSRKYYNGNVDVHVHCLYM